MVMSIMHSNLTLKEHNIWNQLYRIWQNLCPLLSVKVKEKTSRNCSGILRLVVRIIKWASLQIIIVAIAYVIDY
jgi:hypothetical protein